LAPATAIATAAATAAPTASIQPSPTPGVWFPALPAADPGVEQTAVRCTGQIGPSDPVAIVGLDPKGGGEFPLVLRDYADPANPRTACTFNLDALELVGLIDGRHVLLASDGGISGLYAVVDLPEARYRWFRLPEGTPGHPPRLVAVAPALDRIIWLSLDPDVAMADKLHVTTAEGDTVVATMPDTNTGRCGVADDSKFGAFRQSGSLAYVLNQPGPTEESLVVLDGDHIRFSLIAPSKSWANADRPLMPVWSPTADVLYYRRGMDVFRWTPATGPTQFLRGVPWQFPTISPDGRHLAYAAPRADGTNDVYLVHLDQGGSAQRLGSGRRNFPSFLNNSQLWYLGTSEAAGCTGGLPKPLVYNLESKSEAPSVIYQVRYAWPATSSNY
jgi:hypothetical protein